jgi:ATP-dependent DNA helicase PIF1
VETKHTDEDEEKPFGGLNMIVAGDFFQLSPINETYCFKSILFEPFQCIWLEQNMRQREDIQWCNLLDRIRMGELSDADRATLEERVVTDKTEADNLDVDMRLFPTTAVVAEFNDMKQRELGRNVVKIQSIDLYSVNDIASGCIAEKDSIPKDFRDAGGLPHELIVCKDTRLMLVRNIASDLVNGDMGYCNHVDFDETGIAVKIYVQFDDPEIGTEFQDGKHGTCVALERIETEFNYRGRFISRTQFPLVKSWAVTIHKSQGMSLSSGFIHIGHLIFNYAMIYVALSRMRTLQGVHIDGTRKGDWIKMDRLQPNKYVLEWSLKMKELWKALKKSIDRNTPN